jgi:ubiquinone/menaquinone biosynthesis C-methylase UbiE
MKSVINLKSDVYYHGIYWNNYPLVVDYMSKNFTGDSKKWWVEDFKVRYALKPFKHGLFLNCGDGRWERDFVDKKIVKKITAFDVSPDLIKKAKKLKGKRPIRYFVSDVNKVDFSKNEFDLVVNYAALHHTQFINRISRVLAKCLKPDGVFVNFEYIGPHRNQYPISQWIFTNLVNGSLPSFARQKLGYPHLPTMLVMDPSEAVHSELIMESVARYFNVIEKHDTGGGIAYLLLTHNRNTAKMQPKKLDPIIRKILYWDRLLTKLHLVPQLFTYFVATARKENLSKGKVNTRFQKEENQREDLAGKRRGAYSFVDYLKLVKNGRSFREKIYLLIRYPYLENIIFLLKKVAFGF